MIPSAEAAAQRLLTEQFIRADAENVVLTPRTRTGDGAGGFRTVASAPLPSQVGRLIPTKETSVERPTLDGRLVLPEFVLLLNYGGTMSRGARFSLNGRDFEVVYVHENTEYQVKGEVIQV